MALQEMTVLVHRQAAKYGDKPALKYKDYDTETWIPVGWNEFDRIVRLAANALVALEVEEQENVGIFSQNKPECLYTDFAAFANRAVTIPLYATSSPLQVQYIVNDACIRYLFIGEQFQYDAAFSVFGYCETLKQMIIFDRSVRKDPRDLTSLYWDEFLELGKGLPHQALVDERTARVDEHDLMNILYTSGTTGEPKGVMLRYSNYNEIFRVHDDLLSTLTDHDVSLNFLPLTHIFEKAWTYFCLHRGTLVCVNLRPAEVQQSLREVRPTVMCSVPRFWEKVYQGVHERIANESPLRRALMLNALKVGREHNLDYVRLGKTPPLMLRMKYKFYEKTIYALLKKTIGLENGNFFPTAGAAVSDEICEFAHSVGLNMMVGYGLTESTATVSLYHVQDFEIGSVGNIIPGLEVKINENSEILLRGKTITDGYYKKPRATAEAFDADGWFHTGDAGYLHNGHLYLTGRIKELFKTSNGKYISPQALETRLTIDRYIDQIAIIADRRKFVSALIVPVYEYVKEYAARKNISYNSMEELLKHPKILALFQARIDTLQQQFAHYEQVKRFVLLPRPFSMEQGELTNTLKLRRAVVAEHFKDVIDKIYEEAEAEKHVF
ncbi:MAG TPA: long-chain fatty acid--CoA ligase [Candidatus Bacteroides avicola]|jgi:long-chain acyl-CoA synthetase|uniref:Long-chain fatty acid--CoA ligase n=1 Tax=Candidatus Bacteroides avicola TaxID=2838468 RepID=A0A9D2HVB9_9BACE|nr:long-chain fatty acid--CoA ligase [Candidatus Bacteroides avicola]